MARLELRRLSKRFANHVAVTDFTLDVRDAEFVVLLGPSGCGKTTTLRMIAGFDEPTSGVALIGGIEVTHLPPWRRKTGMVFQSYALFPHLTVAENIAFGLEVRNLPRTEITIRREEVLRLVRLEGLSGRLPRELSGGQQQRVALARALAIRPDVLLLDEPFSNLDAKLREEVRIEIRQLQRQLGLTTVMVTHDQEEALAVADRLVVMSQGEIRQVGTQQELYETPADRFVADFVGRSTSLEGKITAPGELETFAGLRIKIPISAVEGRASFVLRPERLALSPSGGFDNIMAGIVEFVSYLGATLEVHVRLSPADLVVARLPNRGDAGNPVRIVVGDAIEVGWSCEAGWVFVG